MAPKKTYSDQMKEEFSKLIDRLELEDLQKNFLKSRWLDQLLWLEGKATKLRARSTRLSLIAIVGGVLLPALVTYSVNDAGSSAFSHYLKWGFSIGTFAISQLVAVSAAIEQYFKNGEKSIQYRTSAETLKSEAWQFFQLTGPYDKFKEHKAAYKTFAARVEETLKEDVKVITTIAKKEEEEIETRMGETEENASNEGERLLGEISPTGRVGERSPS